MGGKGSGGLRVAQIDNQLIESQSDIANWQNSLRAACFNAISPDDMSDIIKKQIEKAKDGNVQSANFMMALVGTNKPVQVKQTNVVVTDVETAARISKQSRFSDEQN